MRIFSRNENYKQALKKISKKDRESLRSLVLLLQEVKLSSAKGYGEAKPSSAKSFGEAKKKLNIKKLQNSDFYRVRKGRFRIIFHIEKKTVVIDSIKLRNENTYK